VAAAQDSGPAAKAIAAIHAREELVLRSGLPAAALAPVDRAVPDGEGSPCPYALFFFGICVIDNLLFIMGDSER